MKHFHVIVVTILIDMITLWEAAKYFIVMLSIIYLNLFILDIYVPGWFSVNTLIYVIVDTIVFFFWLIISLG